MSYNGFDYFGNKRINILEWSSEYPNLNPIENLLLICDKKL